MYLSIYVSPYLSIYVSPYLSICVYLIYLCIFNLSIYLEVASMGPLIDTELERIDRQHAR